MGGKKSGKKGCLWELNNLLDNIYVSTFQYLLFVYAFQMLLGYTRNEEEYFLTNQINQVFVYNEFDSHHHGLEDVRRVHDFWEWSYQVLIPGIFSNTPSVDSDQETWTDGTQTSPLLSMAGATPFTPWELREQMNYLDFTRGIILRQVRIEPKDGNNCPGGTACLGKTVWPHENVNKDPYGYKMNGTDQFQYWGGGEEGLGGDPLGLYSASLFSTLVYPSGGFVAIIIPFFSTEYLPFEKGTWEQITDYRKFAVGKSSRTPAYYCVRTSHNGVILEQICDGQPGNMTAEEAKDKPVTQVVYNQVMKLFDELRVHHWIDFHTRLVAVQLQISNPNKGMAILPKMLFEFPPQGGVLPSTNLLSMTEAPDALEGLELWSNIVLGCMIYFILIEFLELKVKGCAAYMKDGWNLLDWINFILFFVTYSNIRACYHKMDEKFKCNAIFCHQTGFDDDFARFRYFMLAKQTIGINATLQLLKIVQFTNRAVPKMSLLSRVLEQGFQDLFFFSIIFGLSLYAFANMFYVLLGTNIGDFYDMPSSIMSLTRALFGDFDLDSIEENSQDHLNAILFLAYLFVAVFILLSMFLAILADAQGFVTATDEWKREKAAQNWAFLHDAWATGLLTSLREKRNSLGESPNRNASPIQPEYSVNVRQAGKINSSQEEASELPDMTIQPLTITTMNAGPLPWQELQQDTAIASIEEKVDKHIHALTARQETLERILVSVSQRIADRNKS